MKISWERVLELRTTLGLIKAREQAAKEVALETIETALTVEELKPVLKYLVSKL
jgi:hypothetical protein